MSTEERSTEKSNTEETNTDETRDGTSRRPAPEYGEYATPEEVAAITGRPVEAPAPDPVPAALPSRVDAGGPRPASSTSPSATPAAAPRRPWDTAIAVGLLAVGAWNAVGVIADPGRFATQLQTVISDQGHDVDVIDGLTHGIGIGLAIAFGLLVVACGVLTVVAMRRGARRIFWIPLCGLVLSFFAEVFAIVLVFIAHPAILGP